MIRDQAFDWRSVAPLHKRFLTALWLLCLVTNSLPAIEPPSQSNGPSNEALPVFVLNINRPLSTDKVPFSLMLQSTNSVPSEVGATWSGAIRIRGGVSQGYEKKSFGITFDQPRRLLGMRSSSHWILNAAFIDRSLMRHKLAYDLFRSMSEPGQPRFAASSRFVEVYRSTNYYGVYLLMERVDRALLGLRPFRSNETSHACIYKAVDHSANFAQPGHFGFEQHEPDRVTTPYWKPLDEFNRFVSTSTDDHFWNPASGIEARLDIGNAIDFYLLVLLTCNLDGITKNYILARDAAPGLATPRFFFVPWDYDGTFGRNWDASRVDPTAWLSNHLFDRLMDHASFRLQLSARWRRLREQALSLKSITAMIDANAQDIGAAAGRNAQRWQASGGYPDQLSFAEDVAQMKQWVAARLQWLDAEIYRRARE